MLCLMRSPWKTVHFFILSCVLAQEPVANLPQGRIVGIKVFTENSLTPVEIFFGIPYAVPPVGRHRFSAPERHKGWRRTFFAHRIPPKCPQVGDNGNGYVSEDCLFLNIWTPTHADGSSLPVVVALYSESWDKGGMTLPFQELASEGVVVVSVSYRLHVLSFFTLRSLAARGNLALLDQYLALLWVRDNIAAFGGDPQAITLIGHSAGADSILYHLASPRSIGLIQRAILMSPQNIWKTMDKDVEVNSTDVEKFSLEMARTLGCTSDIDQEILQCMRAHSLSDIMALYSVNGTNGQLLQPISEDFLPESEQFLPDPLNVALSANKRHIQLDLLLGATDLEDIKNGDIYDHLLKRGGAHAVEYANTRAIPAILELFSLHLPEAVPLLQQAIRWEFWGAKARGQDEKDTLESVEALARMTTSAKWGAGGALLAARLARRVSRLYTYRYSQPGVDLSGLQRNFSGAVHGSDLVALLGDALMLQLARRPPTPEEKRFSTHFRQYIVNFIKYGIPAPEEEWPRYKVGNAHIHEIKDVDRDCSDIHSNKEAAFWLQYLPQLSASLGAAGRTEQLTSTGGESRLRGGVFALCGVSVVLLTLLLACAILIHRERSHRFMDVDSPLDSHIGIN